MASQHQKTRTAPPRLWHYRYVGVEAATAIMSRDLTPEEYPEETYG